MTFQPASTLRSRTFLGLLVAQFFAAFNDQAIHAAGMFYAINQQALSEAQAISLMPILFYAPWVLFSTFAGYLADRYSKRSSLVFWKGAEIVITAVALGGFWLGTAQHSGYGPWIVLGTVFLMGLHSTFFVPAKYGVMPEILQPQLLSRGNGLLESLSFLAVILGTVCGGVLSFYFQGQEYYIGLILFGLAVVGAVASLMIERMPAADPQRRFPTLLYGPLVTNLRVMIRSKPLGLAVLGIAFFTFVVVFMRATVYMHGESRVERWDELKTSIVVGMTALGIGLGSPLAGFLSGRKIELGLIPLGALGMVLATLLAAVMLDVLPWLVGGIILIGFFTGFYIVPLFTLLQHRAPKASKGDIIATNNCLSVAGAIAASLLFFGLESAAERFGFAAAVQPQPIRSGTLTELTFTRGQPSAFTVRGPGGEFHDVAHEARQEIQLRKKGLIERLQVGDEVDLATYKIDRVTHYVLRPASSDPWRLAYNKSHVPRYLFIGAAAITLITLILLRMRLPDLLARTFLWLRWLGRVQLRVEGVQNLPSEAAAVLVTNCRTVEDCLLVLAATDRTTRFVFPGNLRDAGLPLLLRQQLRPSTLAVLPPAAATEDAVTKAAHALSRDLVVGLPGSVSDHFLLDLARKATAVLVPVHCDSGDSDPARNGAVAGVPRMARVVFGLPLPAGTHPEEVRAALDRLAKEHAPAMAATH